MRGLVHHLDPDRKRKRGTVTAWNNCHRLIKTYPDPGRKLRREAHVPCIREIICRSGFARGRPGKRFGAYSRAEIDYILEHSHHRARDLRRNHVVHCRACFLQQGTVVSCDTANEMRIDANPVVRENRERGNVFHQVQICGAESNRQIGRQGTLNSKAASHVDYVVDADFRFRDVF